MTTPKHPFRLNVGFIVAEHIGYSREFPVEFADVHLPPDLVLDEVYGNITITRTAQGLLAQVKLRAKITTECMRCLEPFELQLSTNFIELYAFNKSSVTDSGLILPETGQIDFSPLVREYLVLAIPIKPLCKLDCKGLCPVCGENQNERICNHEDDSIDPRLSILRSLLDAKKPT